MYVFREYYRMHVSEAPVFRHKRLHFEIRPTLVGTDHLHDRKATFEVV